MSASKRVLIIDDSLVSRMMIKKGIEDVCPSWTLLEAKDGEQALEIINDHEFDCFSIDFNMPGMDGLELMAILNEKFPDTKKALLTANIQDAIRDKTLSLGGQCINKPISEKTIEQLVGYFND